MASRNAMSGMLDDYKNLRAIPALLSVFFVLASLYQFGGIASVELSWFNYTLTTQHALFVSMGAYAVAFASSETRTFEAYDSWEQAMIAAGPLVIIGHEYVQFITDLIATEGNTGPILAFLLVVISWGVAVR